jgi:hypothetical protein
VKLWATHFNKLSINNDDDDEENNKDTNVNKNTLKRGKCYSYEPQTTHSNINTNKTTNISTNDQSITTRARGFSLGFCPPLPTPLIPGENDERNHFTIYKTLTGHQRWVWDCAFSSDSEFLITGKIISNTAKQSNQSVDWF